MLLAKGPSQDLLFLITFIYLDGEPHLSFYEFAD
jgi:hypothetical protein